jgi:DNA adenine methylase
VSAEADPRPFLKWAGGKRQLLPQIRRFYPAVIGRYFEPFLGSGAVFFDLVRSGRLHHSAATLTDENADLIGTYLRVRDATDAVIDALESLASGYRRRGRHHYYEIRDEHFNPARGVWQVSGGRAEDYPVALAAMLIYLNRTGYNGLFRLNASGNFNVPAGSYDDPPIVNAERLRAAAAALCGRGMALRQAPFEHVADIASSGDLVYLDPPYAPLSATSNFRAYTTRGFERVDHRRLRDVVITLARRGAAVILSNSTAPEIVKLYDDRNVRKAGLRSCRVPARRAINSRTDRRGVVEELIVTNVPENARLGIDDLERVSGDRVAKL